MADMQVNEFAPSNGVQDGSQLRWGYTALSIENKDVATNDEIMIDKKSGRIYYKRPDGKIVSWEQPMDVSNTSALIAEAYTAMNKTKAAGSTLTVDQTHADYVLKNNYAIGTFGSTGSIIGPITMSNTEFKLTLRENFFGLKVNSRDTDKGVIELLTKAKMTPAEVSGTSEISNVKVNVTIDVVNVNAGETTHVVNTLDYDLIINSLGICTIPALYLSEAYETRYAIVTVNTISFPKFSSMTPIEIATLLSASSLVNFKNEDNDIKVDTVDVVSFIDNGNDINYGEGIKTKTLVLANTFFTEMDLSSGLNPEERTEINNLKTQVTAIPLVTIGNVKPTGIRTGDIWAETITSISAAGVKTPNASTTFVKDTVEKYLAGIN